MPKPYTAPEPIFYKFRPFSRPKRWVFKDPDSGFVYEEQNEKALIQRIINYRSQNSLPIIKHLDKVLQNYWCRLPENLGECEPCKMLERGLLAYIRGGIALLDNLWYGEAARVPQEEADRRAEICTGCKYNTNPDKGWFDIWADNMAQKSVGDAKSKHHVLLFNCEICSCNLRAKVFYKGDMGLNAEQKSQMQDVGCWQTENKKE
jgi:hypothetical protein